MFRDNASHNHAMTLDATTHMTVIFLSTNLRKHTPSLEVETVVYQKEVTHQVVSLSLCLKETQSEALCSRLLSILLL